MKHAALLVADLVESVRLLQLSERSVIPRWEQFIARVRAQCLPQQNGRLVKSLGDGLMSTFADARHALACAEQMLALLRELNAGQPQDQLLQLRLGVHLTEWVEGELDIYGHGVNLCVRLAALAQPQTVVMSADTLAALGLDGAEAWQVRDLGRCYLKHVAMPEHCWLLKLPEASGVRATQPLTELRPRIAVLPVQEQEGSELPPGASAVLRDDLVRALAANPNWQVVSRLSTHALQQASDLGDTQGLLWVRLKLSGDPLGAELDLQLLEGEQELWGGHYEMPWMRLLQPSAGLMPRVVAAMDQALLRQGTLALHEAALPNIPSYSLLLRAVQSLHRLRPESMTQARTMLDHLAERHPRSSDVQAWLAKCHFVHLHQLQPSDPQACADQVRQAAEQAIELDKKQGVALALRAQLLGFHEGRLEESHRLLMEAVELAPNEPLGWAYLCHTQALTGVDQALSSFNRAEALAPLDPLGFELQMFGSIVHSAVGSPQEALRLARKSVELAPLYLSGLVQLIISLVQAAEMDEARATARRYLQLRPQASVQRFIDRHVAGTRPIVRQQAEALLAAGLPL